MSHDDLIAAIKAGLPQKTKAESSTGTTSSTEASSTGAASSAGATGDTDAVAESIAARVGPPPGGPRPGELKGVDSGLRDDTKLQQVSQCSA